MYNVPIERTISYCDKFPFGVVSCFVRHRPRQPYSLSVPLSSIDSDTLSNRASVLLYIPKNRSPTRSLFVKRSTLKDCPLQPPNPVCTIALKYMSKLYKLSLKIPSKALTSLLAYHKRAAHHDLHTYILIRYSRTRVRPQTKERCEFFGYRWSSRRRVGVERKRVGTDEEARQDRREEAHRDRRDEPQTKMSVFAWALGEYDASIGISKSKKESAGVYRKDA
ncbi:hypothetical protein BDW02DRAFT_579888 [Decorospora gaudefroyi]|uniref:Uncharacterized protein n=1 Tax=Decorospora gaudefroyi TaxID=184978 RepID=A0A6A5KCF5_9PLEO|nr:hypothetical protein BDW02DRAFT_579888 [Decorospora gaudefroyi]